MKCPLCDLALSPAPVGDAPALRCLSCLGLWLPSGSLAAILSSTENRAAIGAVDSRRVTWAGPSRKTRCPACAGALFEHFYGGITPDRFVSETEVVRIDSCASCRGIWLDRGELLRINDIKTKGELHTGMDKALAAGMAEEERERRERLEGPRKGIALFELATGAPASGELTGQLAALLLAKLLK